MARRRKRRASDEEGSLLGLLLLLVLAFFRDMLANPILASVVLGVIAATTVFLILVLLRVARVRKANLLTRKSLHRDYSPAEFEHVTAEIFRQQGYRANVTQFSGDRGIDIILSKNGKRFGVQCKRYKEAVGPAFIREFVGALEGAGLSRGFFVTTSRFTKGAFEAARRTRAKVELVPGKTLATWKNEVENAVNTDLIQTKWWSAMGRLERIFVTAIFFVIVSFIVGLATYLLLTPGVGQ